ncbi:UBP1-associated protein 2C [Linum perenne]
MDFSKKRKIDEFGVQSSPDANATTTATSALTPDDIRKIIEPFTKDQLLDILQTAAVHHSDVLDAIRSLADSDVTARKLFIRGLSADTTTETLRGLFSSYGELDEAIVILDKNTGKSKGYGFVTFKHIDGARMALKEPSKKIDGRMTVTQLASAGQSGSGSSAVDLASAGQSGSGSSAVDVSLRKIYVGNVPYDIPSERLLAFFSMYGEIEEGPLGFDKSSGKAKGFAFMIYKTEEGARAAIAEPMKNINGFQVVCKLAADNKKGKNHGAENAQAQPNMQQGSMQHQQPYGSGNMPSYGGYAGGVNSGNYGMNGSMPGPMGNGGYGGQYGVPQYGGPGSGEYGLNSAAGTMFRPPPSSGGMGAAGYADGGPYGMAQQHQPPSMPPRIPPGGMYPGGPPYY